MQEDPLFRLPWPSSQSGPSGHHPVGSRGTRTTGCFCTASGSADVGVLPCLHLQNLTMRKRLTLGCCLCIIFKNFISIQFASIQYNTQCSSHHIPSSVPVTQLPHPLTSSPSATLCFSELGVSHGLSSSLILPQFPFLPLWSLSLFLIFLI